MSSYAFVHVIYIWEPDASENSTPYELIYSECHASTGNIADWAKEELSVDDWGLREELIGKPTGIYSIMAMITLTALAGGFEVSTEMAINHAVVERLSEDEFSRSPVSGVNLSDEDKQLLFEPEKPVGITLTLEAL